MRDLGNKVSVICIKEKYYFVCLLEFRLKFLVRRIIVLSYRIGRNPDQQLRLIDDMISREHCVLTYINQSWHVEDKKSLNKSFIDGTELVPHQVISDSA